MVLMGALLLYSGAEPHALFGPLGECKATASVRETTPDVISLQYNVPTVGRALAVNMCIMHILKQIFRVPRPAWAKGSQLPNR